MQMRKPFLGLYVAFMLYGLIACQPGPTKENRIDAQAATQQEAQTRVKYAKGFSIKEESGRSILTINQPYPGAKVPLEYVFEKSVEQDAKKPALPLKRVVVTSTTHIPMLDQLDQLEALVGFPNPKYIANPKAVELLEKGLIKDVGNDQQLNTELVLGLAPDAVIAFSMGAEDRSLQVLEKNGIQVIFNGDWLESTPLGRAEWIKFFGFLFDQQEKADSLFRVIEQEYLTAKNLAKEAAKSPTVLTGSLFKDVWNLPAGESFAVEMLSDANLDYLWKDTKGQGSLTIGFEAVIDKARNADLWIGVGNYQTRQELLTANERYAEFSALKNGKAFTYAQKRSPNGGILYYEEGLIKPHLVLKDLIKAGHPSLLPDYQPHFLTPLTE